MSAFDNFVSALEARDLRVRRNGVKAAAEAQCPAHDDRNASLSVGVGENERVLLHCHAGCQPEDILAALGLLTRELFNENGHRNGNGQHREIVAIYDYVDEAGELLFQVVRFRPKDFRQRRPDGAGDWVWNLNGTRRVPYRLPSVIEAVKAGRPVWICEGEKDVHALERAGQVATCNPGGAGKWRPEYAEVLRGARVAIVTDKDDAGRKHAAEIARTLEAVAEEVRVGEAAEGKDAADHLAAGRGVHEFVPADLTAPTATEQNSTWSDFFDGKTFVPQRLAESLREQFPTATGGRQLYAFRDGAYRPSEDHLRHEITTVLGAEWKARRADEVLAYLLQSSESLWEAPPRDRIAVANGILSLPDRELAPATPKFRSPVRITANYDAGARCPAIERFLEQVFPGGAELLYEVIGHLMVPENRQRAFMFLGPGGNGKSTVLRLVKAFLGRENVSAVGLHALEENRFATADLYGKLANIYADLDARALTATGIFKSITGGDPIRGERKHRDAFEFIAYARLIFSANEPPPTTDSSQAFFDRWIIVPFEQRIRGSSHERQQDDLLAELTTPEEFSGVLNHALDGLERLRRSGRFTTSNATHKAGENFRVAADSVAGFVHERCTEQPNARAARAVLWHAYRSWCEENNRRPLSAQRFHGRVRELISDLDEVAVQGTRTYIGISLEEQ